MGREEITLQNFIGGEQSPRMYGRYDLPLFRAGCRRVENFVIQVQGDAWYRPGTVFVNHTRRNKIANLLRFQFNDSQAYVLEFTDLKLRFYKDEALILESVNRVI